MREYTLAPEPVTQTTAFSALTFSTLERHLVVESDASEILDYLSSAYRRLLVPAFDVDSSVKPADAGRIAAVPEQRWLSFNGADVKYDDDDVSTNFRRSFYGASKLFRLSFQRNPDWHSLYGAAVCVGGKAVLLSAQSGIGKTTLALSMLARGATLYSDEFVFLRRSDLTVSGLPRALMIRERSLSMCPDPRLREVCLRSKPRIPHGDRVWDTIDAGEVFGEEVFAQPAPLAAAIILERSQTESVVVERIAPALAAADFTKRFNAEIKGFERLALVAQLFATTPCYRLIARSPDVAAQAIEKLL